MRYFILSFLVFMWLVGVSAGDAAAQEAEAAAQQPEPVATYTLALLSVTGTAPASIIHYEDRERAALERGVRRSRKALIGTSVAAAVGLPLWLVGITVGCSDVHASTIRDRTCTKGGNALRGVGITLFWGGLAGMLISGTMVGVKRRQLDDLGYRAAYPKTRAVQWDPASSSFVF